MPNCLSICESSKLNLFLHHDFIANTFSVEEHKHTHMSCVVSCGQTPFRTEGRVSMHCGANSPVHLLAASTATAVSWPGKEISLCDYGPATLISSFPGSPCATLTVTMAWERGYYPGLGARLLPWPGSEATTLAWERGYHPGLGARLLPWPGSEATTLAWERGYHPGLGARLPPWPGSEATTLAWEQGYYPGLGARLLPSRNVLRE